MSNNLKYGKVAGIDLSLRDVSTERSEYVVENRDMLVKYARGLNIDFNSADDLVNDLWLSFRKNEADGVGYIEDGSEYLGYISVEVAVKSRLKLMAKNKAYARLSNNDKNVIANFTDDIDDDKDDPLTEALKCQANRVESSISDIETEESLREAMEHFIACTSDCTIPGIDLLKRMDQLEILAEEGGISKSSQMLMAGIYDRGEDVIDSLKGILHCFLNNKKYYSETLKAVEEEFQSCRELFLMTA